MTDAVFLSYRREDTKHAAGRLAQRLGERFPVFMDVDSIAAGSDFVSSLRQAVDGASALLALIGPGWLEAADESGVRRIDQPGDWVAAEIATALEHDVPVLPVLVDGAPMPSVSELPPALAGLASRQGVRVAHESFAVDSAHLLEVLDRLFKAPAAVPSPPRSLPRPPGALLGRQLDVSQLEALLTDRAVRLVTMVGPGGVGKTRLAMEVADRASEGREVVFVPLDVVATPELVLPTLAAQLQLRPSGEVDLVTHIAAATRNRDLLLVLDNFEHLMDAAGDVAALTRDATDLQILVTSREALRVRGEHVYRLPPLETHDAAGPADGATGATSPAVALFCARAEEAGAQLDLDECLRAITEICDRLDGLPLAIELAAARTAVLSPQAILERLNRRTGLLTAGRRDAPERQRSLRACLEWSVGLLTPDDGRLFATMSVFAGGFTLEGLEAVCADVLPEMDPLTGVDSLVAKSLVSVAAGSAGPRFVMLETIREYAGDLLTASGDEQQVRAAHASWIVGLLAAPPDVVSRRPRNVRERAVWSDELPDARAALAHLDSLGEHQAMADLVAGVANLWKMRGDWAELEGWSTTLADQSQVIDERRIELLAWAAFVAMILGKLDLSRERVERGFALCGEDRFPVLRVRLWLAACSVSFCEGDLAQTQVEVLRALEVARATGDVELTALATSYQLTPLTRDDVSVWERAVAASRADGDQNQELNLLINFSELSVSNEDARIVELGVAAALGAVEVAETLGSLDQQAAALDNAGANLLLDGSPQAAAEHLRSALRLGARLGDTGVQVESLVRLAAAEAALGHRELARDIYADWYVLGDGWPRGAGPANERLIDTYLREIRDERREEATGGTDVTLASAVERALSGPGAQ